MLHLEDHAFARGERLERSFNFVPDFEAEEMPLGVRLAAAGRLLPIEEVRRTALAGGVGMDDRSLVFGMAATSAQMVEADVGDNAVDPGVKGAIKTEARQVAINLDEGFLVDILGVFGAAQNIEREAQDLAVVALDENFEGGAVACLGALDEDAVLGRGK